MINASLRRLLVFKAVYELRGVNAAADHLDIAQPSVTAHVKALEAGLGATLFVRQRGRRLRATESGEALYRYSCQVIAASQATQDELQKLQKPSTALSLGFQRSIASRIIPAQFAQFVNKHPQARFSIHSETQEGLAALLHAQQVHLGLLFAPVEASGYRCEVIGEERLVIIAAPTHPLARRKNIDPRVVEQHDFVGPIQRSQFSTLIDAEMRRIGLRNRNTTIRLQDTASVKEAVVHGLGVACTLHSSCRDEIQRNALVALDVDAPPMSLAVQCSSLFPPNLPDLGGAFISFLKASRVWA